MASTPSPSRSPGTQARLRSPAPPWRLVVVSEQQGLGLAVQARLDEVAPRRYLVRQVWTRQDLETLLWEAAQFRQEVDACLIDTAGPTLQDAPRAWYTWLAWFTRPVALLDATLTRAEQFHALLELGFHALLPAWAHGGYLHFLLSLLVRPEPARPAGEDPPLSQREDGEQRCLACAALLPASAQFCGTCGTPLPARGPASTRVLVPVGGQVSDGERLGQRQDAVLSP